MQLMRGAFVIRGRVRRTPFLSNPPGPAAVGCALRASDALCGGELSASVQQPLKSEGSKRFIAARGYFGVKMVGGLNIHRFCMLSKSTRHSLKDARPSSAQPADTYGLSSMRDRTLTSGECGTTEQPISGPLALSGSPSSPPGIERATWDIKKVS